MEQWLNTEKKGNNSLHIKGNQVLVNSVDNSLYLYDLLHCDSTPPKVFKAHKSGFYGKATASR